MTEEERLAVLGQKLEAWLLRWQALRDWLREARGRDYVTRTPAVVLQKMADLEEQG